MLAVTSQAAIRALQDRGAAAILTRMPVYAVGPRTAEAARAAGAGQVVCGAGEGRSLARRIAEEMVRQPHSGDYDVLYLAGRRRSPGFEATLAEAGLSVHVAVLYDMEPVRYARPELRRRLTSPPDTVLFYSPAAARRFAELVPAREWRDMLPEAALLCLSERTAQALGDLRSEFPVRVAARPSEAALLDLLPA